MTECEIFYKKTNTEIEIILRDKPFLFHVSQNWKSKDFIISWDTDHLEQYIYSAYSPHIENLRDDIKHIMKRVMSLLLLYNGSQNITQLNLLSTISATDIYCKEFSEKLWATEIEEYPFEHNEAFYDSSCFQYENTPLDSVLFDLTKVDEIIRTLLSLAGLITFPNSFENSILNWGTLYKIYDTVNYGCKKFDINIYDLSSKAKIKAFTATCNNMSILGINSRHGLKEYGDPPGNIIDNLEEAIYIILCLSKNFSTEYIKIAHGINYNGNKCNIDNFDKGRMFNHFSKQDYNELFTESSKDL